MHCRSLLLFACVGLWVQASSGDLHEVARLRRQDTTNSLPSLPTTTANQSNNGSPTPSSAASTSASGSAAPSSSNSGAAPSSTNSSSSSAPSSSHTSSSHSISTSIHVSRTSAAASSTTAASSATSTAEPNLNQSLPIQPQITPALSIAGVILILTGTTHALIGIKNKWIQIFLSTAYLVSIAVLVLIDYVMHPPVSNAIQGAYFVAIFMTGCIGGGGALIFKEISEGLGCLLGGFSLGMWFLTLRSGGVIEGSTGVGILLAIFCVVGWLLYFIKFTRDYALIGSTAFAGATALTLGIDCFSRAGYKEFWLYIWNLNGDLFPLNTDTYPLTRGIRVEIAAIVIGTIVGVISQLRLWKVVRERRREKEANRLEEESRRDAVDEALGRHLQRQNEVAKQQWERVYGDDAKRPMSMVDSVLDSEGQSKRGSRVSVIRTRMHAGLGPQTQVVEMRPVNPRSSTANLNRQSTLDVSAIPEENEDGEQDNEDADRVPHNKSTDRILAQHDLEAQHDTRKTSEDTAPHSAPSLTEGPTYPNTTNDVSSVGNSDPEPAPKVAKRRSFQSFLRRLSGHSANPGSGPSSPGLANMSAEALIVQPSRAPSRASSVAATLDEEHDKPDPSRLSALPAEGAKPPAIVVSPARHMNDEKLQRKRSFLDVPPSPPALSVDFDPEELARPVAHAGSLEVKKSETSLRSISQTQYQAQSQSQTPERRGSSGDLSPVDGPRTHLTLDALEAVPSQLSNVVLSYRTNEWAKHATTAEIPLVEEPQSVSDDDKDELPTTVLNTVTGTKPEPQSPVKKSPEKATSTDSLPISDKSLLAASKPPKPHILPQREDTVKSNASGGSAESGGLQKDTLKQNQSAIELSRITSKPKPVLSTGRGLRSSSTPMLSQSLVTSPIEENRETSFPQSGRVSATPTPGGAAVLNAQRQNLLRNQSIQRSASQQELSLRQSAVRFSTQAEHQVQAGMIRSVSRTSTATENTDILGPSSGRMTPLQQLGEIARPSTRLSTYDSRQPIRHNTAPTQQQRESMLAEWRNSMRQDVGLAERPEQSLAQRRAEMLAQKAMLKRSESQQGFLQATRDNAMDQLMRRGDMQEAHRAALRKMQARANEKAK